MKKPVHKRIEEYRLEHYETWKAWTLKGRYYPLWRLLQEVVELMGVMIGWHDDSIEHELTQIASICANWIDQGLRPIGTFEIDERGRTVRKDLGNYLENYG